MNLRFFILLLFIFGLLGCKNPPTFSISNKLDPQHENFEVSPPKNFNLQIRLYNDTFDNLHLSWDPPGEEHEIDGYLLKIYDPEKDEFIEVERIPYMYLSTFISKYYTVYSTDLPINITYKLYSLINFNDDSVLYSKPLTASYHQNFTDLTASFVSNDSVSISWNHIVFSENARIYLEKSVNGNNFHSVKDFDLSLKQYIEQVSLSLGDELVYRIFAKKNNQATDTLYAEPINLKTTE